MKKIIHHMRKKGIKHHHVALSIVALIGTIVAGSAIVRDYAEAAFQDYYCTVNVAPALTGSAPFTINVKAAFVTSGWGGMFTLVRWGNGTQNYMPNLTWGVGTSYTYTTPGQYRVSVFTNQETICSQMITVTEPTSEEGGEGDLGENKGSNDGSNSGSKVNTGDDRKPEPKDLKCTLYGNPVFGNAPLLFKMIGVTNGGTFTAIHWGDGTMTNNPVLNTFITHLYSQPGTYQVVALVASGNMADDRAERTKCSVTVQVGVPPSREGTGVTVFTGFTPWPGTTGTNNPDKPKPTTGKVITDDKKPTPATGKVIIDDKTKPVLTGRVIVEDKPAKPASDKETIIKELEVREQRIEYNYVIRFLEKDMTTSERLAVQEIIISFVGEGKEMRVRYQNAIDNNEVYPKNQWMKETDTVMSNYAEALKPYIDAEKYKGFETFIMARKNLMNTVYDRLELIRMVQLQQKKLFTK